MEHREPCPRCGTSLEYRLTAPADDQRGFMYCGVDGALVEWSVRDPVYRHLARARPWELDGRQQGRVERAVRPCPCGGRFAFANPPRCPSCHGSLRDLFPERQFAVVIGARFDADRDDVWNVGRIRRAWYRVTSRLTIRRGTSSRSPSPS